MVIDPADYPNIPWAWRLFINGHYITRIKATTPELIEAQQSIRFVLDREHLTIDLI